MRRLLVGACALGAMLAGAGRAEAQTRVYFGAPQDTAIGLIPSTETRIPIRAASLCGVDSARLTIRYDPATIQLVGVLPAGFGTAIDTVRPAAGLFIVRGSGSVCSSDVEIFTLRAILAPAVNGTFLWASVDSLGVQYVAGDQALAQRTTIAQVCHATQLYGDVDGNGRTDSRDALITLSAAVGLPVTGFDLAVGDVDRDGLANSRDALLMLTYAIGGYLPVATQIGEGAPDACPGTTAPGETVVFKRNGAGIEVLGASSTTPTAVPGTTPFDSAPRLAADGATIVYQCGDSLYPQYYSEVCSIGTAGTGKARLTPGYPTAYTYYVNPDVSPAGTKIAFLSYGSIYTMYDSVNAPQVAFPGSPYSIGSVAWSRDGSRLAYSTSGFYGYINGIYGYWYGVFAADTLGITTVRLDTAYAYGTVRWSPAGDSAAYLRPDGRVWAVPATGGSPAIPLTNFVSANGYDGITWFDWGPQGLIFSFDPWSSGHPSLWLLPGPNAPIQRVTAPMTGDWQPSFRRNP